MYRLLRRWSVWYNIASITLNVTARWALRFTWQANGHVWLLCHPTLMSGRFDKLDRGLDHASKQENQLASKTRLLSALFFPSPLRIENMPILRQHFGVQVGPDYLLFMNVLSLKGYVLSDYGHGQSSPALTSLRRASGYIQFFQNQSKNSVMSTFRSNGGSAAKPSSICCVIHLLVATVGLLELRLFETL